MQQAVNRAGRRQRARVRRELDLRSPFARGAARDRSFGWYDERDESTGRVYAVRNDGAERQEILADAYGDGAHYRPWASKRAAVRPLAASYARLAEAASMDGDFEASAFFKKQAGKVASCGSMLAFGSRMDGVTGRDELRLLYADFCHDPLCPMCGWRRSVKMQSELTAGIDWIEDQIASSLCEPVRYIHLVLTTKNCAPDALSATIDGLHAAFHRLTQTSLWKKRVVGYFQKTEWTWSDSPAMRRAGTPIHPHMHLIIAVPAAYFSDRPESWQINVRRVLRVAGYIPRRSAANCHAYDRAVCSVRAAIARGLLAMASDDGVTPESGPMWRTLYRQRYQRMVAHIDQLADQYRPAVGSDGWAERVAVREFADAVAQQTIDTLYLDQADWLQAWQRALGDETVTQVHVSAIKTRAGQPVGDGDSEGLKSAVKEVCKYVSKSCDYLIENDPDETDRRIGALRQQLNGLRMTGAGGLFKEALAAVRDARDNTDDDGGDEESEDLIHTKKSDGILFDEVMIGRWNNNMRAYAVMRVPVSDEAIEMLDHMLPNGCPDRIRAVIEKQMKMRRLSA